jgi:hypothetical protein
MLTEEEKAAAAINLENFNKVKDTPIFAQHSNAHAQAYFEANKADVYKTAQGEAYGNVDKVLSEVLEVERKDNAKTTEILKPLLEELKTLRSATGKVDDSEAIEALKKKHGTDLEEIQALLIERDNKIKTLETQSLERDIKLSLTEALRDKKFKAHYTQKDIDRSLASELGTVIGNAKIEDGKTIYYNSEGSKMLVKNGTRVGLPMDAKEVVEETFGDMFEVKTAGGDADPNSTGNNNNNTNTAASFENGKVVFNMNFIKTREDFYKAFKTAMAKSAISENTTAYDKLYKDSMLEYGYNDLPSAKK